MALPEAKNVIIGAVLLGIAAIALVFIFNVASQPRKVCGNSNVEFPEQCDGYGCQANEFCNSNCRCQKTEAVKSIQQSSCPDIGGTICPIGEFCSTPQIKMGYGLCCMSSCTNESNEFSVIDSSAPVNSLTGRQDAIELYKNSEISRSAAASVATLSCTLSSGETGIICEEQFCNGDYEDLCCAGSCNSFPYGSYEECLNFCLEEAALTMEGCDAKCR